MDALDFLRTSFPQFRLSKGGIEFLTICPYCTSDDKKKLSINTQNFLYHCWRCGVKGHLNKLCSKLNLYKPEDLDRSIFDIEERICEGMPEGFTFPPPNFAQVYLQKRHIGLDLCRLYHIGYSCRGRFNNRIIIPTFEDGEVVYYVGRSIIPGDPKKYMNPAGIPSGNYVFNLDQACKHDDIILCEGVFSAIAAGENAVAIFGKVLKHEQMFKLLKARPVKLILCFDPDVSDKEIESAGKILETVGLSVWVARIRNGDPAEMPKRDLQKILDNPIKLKNTSWRSNVLKTFIYQQS